MQLHKFQPNNFFFHHQMMIVVWHNFCAHGYFIFEKMMKVDVVDVDEVQTILLCSKLEDKEKRTCITQVN
jgi:hypothetical protein